MKILEEVISQYLDKCITLKEASDKTIEAVYKNPFYFRLEKMQEDDRSDFILYLYSKTEQIIQSYKPELSSFRTYLASFIKSMLRSWMKIKYRKEAQSKAIEDYALTEFTVSVSDTEEEYEIENDSYIKNFSEMPLRVRQYLRTCLKKIPDSTKIMLLALKSENFINASHIRKLHKITDIPEEKILDMFLKLQGPLYKKKLLFNHQKEIQNKSYILKKRSGLLLEKTDEQSNFFTQLEKSRDFHDEIWRNQTERLKKTRFFIPSNMEISKVLGITSDQVRRLQKCLRNLEKEV